MPRGVSNLHSSIFVMNAVFSQNGNAGSLFKSVGDGIQGTLSAGRLVDHGNPAQLEHLVPPTLLCVVLVGY
jgi:hypothetical protein